MLHNVLRRGLICHRSGPRRFLQWPAAPIQRQASSRAPKHSIHDDRDRRPRSSHKLGSQLVRAVGVREPGGTPAIRTNRSWDTIYALSTALGRAGIAVVRISGGGCLDVYRGLCGSKIGSVGSPRHATLRTLYDPLNESSVLDHNAILINFPAPRTNTGENMLELHIHGGNATVKAVLGAIPKVLSDHHIRYAEAGEFTRRAFENGKLNLAQVEALSDQLSAETEQQRRAAVRGSSRHLGVIYESWRKALLHARGEMEALIDFSEDQHFDESPTELLQGVSSKVKAILKSIAEHEAASYRGELLRRGIRIALLGAPNAGKSSLLNQLVGRAASIVSQEAGTTRDIVEVSLDIKGYLCTFADTAGLRTESAVDADSNNSVISAIEREGIRRAKLKASEADLVIALASVEPSSKAHGFFELKYDAESFLLAASAPNAMIIVNKWDLVPNGPMEGDLLRALKGSIGKVIDLEKTPILTASCIDEGNHGKYSRSILGLTKQLLLMFKQMTDLPKDLQDLLGITERSRQLLVKTAKSLNAYLSEAENGDAEADIVIAAEHLREAAASLARITGKGLGDSEEVLGIVFEKFCVGK